MSAPVFVPDFVAADRIPLTHERIISPEPIGKTRRLSMTPPCEACGNRGPWQCECEDEA